MRIQSWNGSQPNSNHSFNMATAAGMAWPLSRSKVPRVRPVTEDRRAFLGGSGQLAHLGDVRPPKSQLDVCALDVLHQPPELGVVVRDLLKLPKVEPIVGARGRSILWELGHALPIQGGRHA